MKFTDITEVKQNVTNMKQLHLMQAKGQRLSDFE